MDFDQHVAVFGYCPCRNRRTAAPDLVFERRVGIAESLFENVIEVCRDDGTLREAREEVYGGSGTSFWRFSERSPNLDVEPPAPLGGEDHLGCFFVATLRDN